MSFVRKKKVNGVEYAQFVENERKNGKIKQRVICSLGRVDKLMEILKK